MEKHSIELGDKKGTQLCGYAGKLLRVDLSTNEIMSEKLDPEELRNFLGGVGYAAKLLYNELPVGIDPLSPLNKLVFATGPLTGTRAPGSGRFAVCFKSPLTNIWGESCSGGEWGGTLKKAGYDFLVIEGKAEEFSYLAIDDDKVEVKTAEHLRGKTTSEKDRIIKEELGDKRLETVTIGPAGENLVRYANIMSRFGDRAAGRCGAGAVMGSKHLLAIAVKGSGKILVAKPDRFSSAAKRSTKIITDNPANKILTIHGTTGDIPMCDNAGDFPTKNWRSNSWGKGNELYDYFFQNNLKGHYPCYRGCVLSCGRKVKVESGRWKTPEHGGGEYESISVFTAFVLNDDVDAAVHASYLCNEYGLDTISTGSSIAFAMDCYDNGIISNEDCDGLDLSWGNTETIVELVKRIAFRKGKLGQILGEGTRIAAEKFGKGAKKLAIQAKGLEAPAHDNRGSRLLALTYGMGNRGMCHIHPLEGHFYDKYKKDFGLIPYGIPDPYEIDRFAEEGKGKIAKLLQDFGVIPDVLGICKIYIYAGLGPGELAEMLSSSTGWNIDGKKLLKIGERVYDLQRMFNAREGIRAKDDMLPERACKSPEFGKDSSTKECEIKDFGKMLKDCYKARGWDMKTGVPHIDKLRQFGLK